MIRVSIVLAVYLFAVLKGFSQTTVNREVCLTNETSDNRYASYSPNGDQIIFESNRDGNWEIYIMDADGSNQRRLTFFKGADSRRPRWHPSGKKILFESNRSGRNQLYALDLNAMSVVRVTNFKTYEPIFATFSPTGNQIALSLKISDDSSSIVIITLEGKILNEVISAGKRSFYPRWSKTGDELLFFSRKDTSNSDDEIYKVNLNTGHESRLTSWPKHNFCPSWSSKNDKIAYVTSMEGNRPEIYVMDADGGKQNRITHNQLGETLPNWSPNDKKILITAYRKGNYQICELSLKN